MTSRSSSSNKRDGPSSPWNKMLVRSRSLEGVHNDENDENSKRRSSKKKSKQAAWSWLLTPPTRLVGNPLQRSAAPTKRNLLSSARPSNLTMCLLKLKENLPQYCRLLSNPSLAHCQEAARIIDSSIATASPQHSPATSSHGSSPNFFRSSPPRATTSQQGLALEGEWETHVSPLLLLAGAEALYGQMELEGLTRLYKTIQSDFRIVKERLCDPWLAGASSSTSTTSSSSSPSQATVARQAATFMSEAFESLQSFLTLKCQLVDMQLRLFSESSQESFLSRAAALIETCRALLPSSNEEECTSKAVAPMLVALHKEIRAWIALLETASHLEQCQFTDTILSARKLKQSMSTSKNNTTVLQLWFQDMMEHFVAIMPLYFDRINAFASPLYGFDAMHLWADSRVASEHYDALVLDFLRKHESKGGPSMAVCIVIDAVSTNNLNFARGFVVRKPPESSTAQLTTAERERKEWQAVYMRSTVHYNTTSASPMSRSPSHGGAGSSISTIMRRSKGGSSFRKGSRHSIMPSEDDFSRSLASIIRPASQDSAAPALHSQMSVMEYPAATGPVSWPHTEWPQLVELVREDLAPATAQDGGFGSVQAVTYRQPEPPPKEKKSASLALGLSPPVPAPPPKPSTNSSFHLVRLSEHITMVAIVKCEDDGKWHLRRTRGHSDEEIRVFLNEMALKLKVTILFDKDSVDAVKKKSRHHSDSSSSKLQHTPEHDLVRAWQQWDEANSQDFLRELKRSFQLRPQSPYMENLRRRGSTVTTPGGRRRKRSLDYSESALAFFVGTDLPLRSGEALQ